MRPERRSPGGGGGPPRDPPRGRARPPDAGPGGGQHVRAGVAVGHGEDVEGVDLVLVQREVGDRGTKAVEEGAPGPGPPAPCPPRSPVAPPGRRPPRAPTPYDPMAARRAISPTARRVTSPRPGTGSSATCCDSFLALRPAGRAAPAIVPRRPARAWVTPPVRHP